MPFTDKLLGLLIGVIICAIFGYVVYIVSKKNKAETLEMVQSLTNEQKEKLTNASLANSSLTIGFIGMEPKVGNHKTQLKVLFYNTFYPNMLEQFMLADISISTKQYNEYQLKQGDYVKIRLDENGAKIVFN